MGILFPLWQAEAVGNYLVQELGPACDRITVAGSVRRRKPMVGDIELLCVPAGDGLFQLDRLDQAVQELMGRGILAFRLNKLGNRTYGRLNKLLIHVSSAIPVDIFSASMENYGMALFVRTGSAEFNVKAMARLKALGTPGHAYGGITGPDGREIPCPDEQTVFRHLGWRYLEPWQRF